MLALEAATGPEGLNAKPLNPPALLPPVLELLFPPKLKDGVEVLPNPPKVEVAGLVASLEELVPKEDPLPKPKEGVALLLEAGAALGPPKEKPVLALKGFAVDEEEAVLALSVTPLLLPPKLKAVEAAFGDVAAPEPKDTVLGGVGRFVVLDEDEPAAAVGAEKEKPAKGLGGAGAEASFLPVSVVLPEGAGSETVSTCLRGEGWRARLVPPGIKADALLDSDVVVVEVGADDGAAGSGEAFFVASTGLPVLVGKEKVLFSSLLSTFAGLKTNPPGGGAFDDDELPPTSFVESGLKELPAKVNAAGGAGGFGVLSTLAEEPETSFLSAVCSFSDVLDDEALKAKPANGLGGAAAESFVVVVVVVVCCEDELGCGEKENPANGAGVVLAGCSEVLDDGAEEDPAAEPKLNVEVLDFVEVAPFCPLAAAVDDLSALFLWESNFPFSFL